MSEGRPQFSLKRLFVSMTVVAVLCGGCLGFAKMHRDALISAERAVYGGRRFTRAEAEAKAGSELLTLPDSEFLESAGKAFPLP
jgi:hypothetical protein